MTEVTKYAPAPWTASMGQIKDANNEVIGNYLFRGKESDLVNGELMAKAPELLQILSSSEELLLAGLQAVNAIIRHEIHSEDIMTTMAEISDRCSDHIKQLRSMTAAFK